ncbi:MULTISPECIES: NifU family protein [unclassified Cryobacterium]|uniref:NifU family protein n=1 Tax=unclassified Cryobacterium TaxID=2649013 RepID=UPI001068E7EC|nr:MULTISPECIES: NifU family protein [unclassified Cryobacterium]TFB96639.1 NifU family protein [Cryobacterium sp. MDB2-A-1]TFC02962.1 NifU family protein [Cryobacterium sp. MDB2-33-2]TFC12923.1 NifU family protein [Cryobacterium sp. MDB2-A-2]TFC21456.1 NifU family protein [Cryobacterium sp. MDB2-10]
MIPLHPEAVHDRPEALRWAMPPGSLGFTGAVRSAPGDLGRLLDTGVLTGLTVGAGSVTTCLSATCSWSSEGAAVRSALHAALENPAEWVPAVAGTPGTRDADLAVAARTVLSGRVGDFIRSHGGVVELVSAHDEVVTVRLTGSCSGCPAVGFTLHARVERALRDLHPGLRSLVAV